MLMFFWAISEIPTNPLQSEDLSASNFEDFPAVVAAEPAALLAGTQRAASSAAQLAAQ